MQVIRKQLDASFYLFHEPVPQTKKDYNREVPKVEIRLQ